MSVILIALSTWLHILATIVFIGHYLFTGLIYLPGLERCLPANALREVLEQVSSRMRPFFGGSLLIFMVTGTHLMLVNPNYLGLGNFFANPWSILIVIKHVLVLGFLALAVFTERAFLGQIGGQKPKALSQFRQALKVNTVLGVLILFLTSVAQAG